VELNEDEQLNYNRYFGIFKHDLIVMLRRNRYLTMNRDITRRLQFLRQLCSNPLADPENIIPIAGPEKPLVMMTLGQLLHETLEQAKRNHEAALTSLEQSLSSFPLSLFFFMLIHHLKSSEEKRGEKKKTSNTEQAQKLVARAEAEVRHIEIKIKEFEAHLGKKSEFKALQLPQSQPESSLKEKEKAPEDKDEGEDDEDDANCPICLDAFEKPVMTKCLHQFCMECAFGLLGNNRVFACPLCRQVDSSLPPSLLLLILLIAILIITIS